MYICLKNEWIDECLLGFENPLLPFAKPSIFTYSLSNIVYMVTIFPKPRFKAHHGLSWKIQCAFKVYST